MSKKNINNKRLYLFTFNQENNPEKQWSMRLTWSKIITILVGILAIFIIITTLLFNFTPLQTLLPNYELRKEYITNTLRVDSLISEVSTRNRYIDNVTNIMLERIVPEIISEPLDSAIATSELINKSERENQFIRKIDESEKFNLKVLSPLAAEGMLFSSPIEVGVIDKIAENYNFTNGIKINMPKNAAISSVYDGNVIDISFNINGGNNVTIQHPKGFVSKYIGLTSIHVNKGAKILSGESIGSVNQISDTSERNFIFELWYNGTPLNPQKYITF